MRGRLIQVFEVELIALNRALQDTADPDAGGPLTSGYDDDFREPVRLTGTVVSNPQIGTQVRTEKASVWLPAQVSTKTFEALEQLAAGAGVHEDTELHVLFHAEDLEAQPGGYTGTVNVGDRIGSVRLRNTGATVLSFPDDGVHGLFVTERRPGGFGLHMAGTPKPNLMKAMLEYRRRGNP